MGYGIKYSTSNISNTLRKGNIATTAAHSANPQNNFHSGIALIDGKHTVVKVHSTNDPDFYSLSDTELVEFVTSLGANVYGVVGAKNYIKSQNDLFYIDNIVRSNMVIDGLVLDLNGKTNASFVDNKPITNLVSNPSMIPTTPTSFYETTSPTYDSNVGGSGWGWHIYPNSNVSDDGGMIWNPDMEDPYGQPGVWIMKKRPGGNSESNWYGSNPGAIDEGKNYVVSVWCKTDQASCFRIHINVTQNGSSYWGYGSSQHTGGGDWERLSVVIPKDSGNTSINSIRCQATGTTINADAQWKYYQIEEGLTPTDWVDGSRTQNTTWYDISGNGNNSTLVNGVEFNGGSKALIFDGTDDRGDSSYYTATDFSDNQSWTINALVNVVSSASAGNSRGGILVNQRYQSEPDPGGFGLNIYNKNYVINLTSGSTNNATSYQNLATSAINYNKIEYITAIWDESENTAKIYRNGKLVNSSTNSSYGWSPRSTGLTQRIGTSTQGGWAYYFPMKFWNVSLYNKALTESEINQNYYGGNIITDDLLLAIDAGNPVSYESGSTTAYSLTGSLNSSLVNGTGYSSNNGGTFIFDGSDDYVTQPYDMSSMSEFTIEFWAKTYNTGSSSGDANTALAGPNGGGTYIRTGFSETNSRVSILFYVNGNEGNSFESANIPYSEFDETGYNHYAFTIKDNDSVNIYFNGEVKKSVNIGSIITTGLSTWYQRWGNYANSYLWDGEIATCKLYDKKLSSNEIQQNYIAHKARFSF